MRRLRYTDAGNNGVELPNALMAEVEETGRAQNRQTVEVLEDAVRQYLDDQKWERLVACGELRAKEKGLTEADVPRLIQEVRNERRGRRVSMSAS